MNFLCSFLKCDEDINCQIVFLKDFCYGPVFLSQLSRGSEHIRSWSDYEREHHNIQVNLKWQLQEYKKASKKTGLEGNPKKNNCSYCALEVTDISNLNII